jgi:tetratricopeptide (TPR) repeat protein
MKWLLIGFISILVGIGAIVPISGFFAVKGLENPGATWGPWATASAARIRMVFGKYDSAAKLWGLAAKTWPDNASNPKVLYRLAFCLEKQKEYGMAKAAYEEYLQHYPQHIWSDQARRRLENLSGLHDE